MAEKSAISFLVCPFRLVEWTSTLVETLYT
jgi:hypothetical protein